uniref:PKD_channel domain-containing protein n=1 Tax=Caenorhabditis japonica TaxID=281687 RepID=A0A8R1DY29_CAEJA
MDHKEKDAMIQIRTLYACIFSFIYATSDELENQDTQGTIANYGGGGFVQKLPLTGSTEAQSAIATLKANRWIDRGTRAIIVDFAVYNANINLFCVVKLLFELPASGGVLTTPKLITYNLLTYQGSSGTVLMAFEGVFCGFILFFIFEELFAIARQRLRYLGQFWNLIDVCLLGFSVATIILSYNRTRIATKRVNYVIENGLTNAPFDDVTSADNAFLNIKACAVFIAWVKVFKFISVNKTMSQLSSTLTRSAKDIGGFAVMFAVFFFAFAQFGYLCFGTQIADYSNLYNSVFALLRLILGDFNFAALENCNRFFGPAFFIAYVFFVFFILLNMFLAIINDSYVEVKAELARKKDGEGILDWFMNKVRGLKKRGKRPDAPESEDATYEDYKLMLYRAGYAEKDINEAYTRFNVTMMTDHIPEKVAEDIADEVARVTEQKRSYMENHRDYANLNRRVDQMQESVFNIVDRIENVNATLQNIEKQRVRQHDGGNLMDLSALMNSEIRNRSTNANDKKDE